MYMSNSFENLVLEAQLTIKSTRPEIVIVSLPRIKALYPAVHSTCHGPSWATSDCRL